MKELGAFRFSSEYCSPSAEAKTGMVNETPREGLIYSLLVMC
jgi:hypothetical protein